ncbi:MAG: ABC transporter ATP-binding protein [Firmicutes bacterium]|nr:ABC transporter ATP-binding protein [Bacillota bacterium]
MKNNNFKLIWKYLKDEKLRLFLYIFLILVSHIPGLSTPLFWGLALESLISGSFVNFGLYLFVWISLDIVFFSILSIPRENIYNYLEIKFNKNVIKDLYRKITDLPAIAHEEIGVGEFINRMASDPERVMELLSKLIKMIFRIIVTIIIIFIIFASSIYLGIEIIIFAFVMWYVSYKFFPKIKKTQESIKKNSDKYIKDATENITGIREIKGLGIKNNVENIMFKNIDSLFKENRKIKKYEINYNNINNLIYFILQFIILFTSGYLVIKGQISYVLFIAIEAYIGRIDQVVESIGDFGVSYNKVKISLKRIDDIVNNKLYNDEKFGNVEIKDTKGIIEFKNVKFKYREDEKNTLNNLSLKLEPNKKIAIVGRSGNGKSTIFNLLLRYFDTNEGEITLDGINIQDLTEESLRENISVIRQNPFIFNMTILDNFKLVNPNISLEEVKKVCKLAYIDKYIESLPKKYDTLIGEGGVNLSGGQKQRLAIARTLLLNTKVILFDEATSALDNESQEYIKKTIDNLVKNHTIIIVAHRLSTIIDADVINVIDKGKLVGTGTHNELLETCNAYKKLYLIENENQKLDE